ncbi:MAG: hypothetical protein N2Z74_08175, partial [Syntrophales bacterium]|nr:hypothetical protein [Syntrophales bacterium]
MRRYVVEVGRRIMVVFFILMALFINADQAFAQYGTCAEYGVREGQCFCVGASKRICSRGQVWDAGTTECGYLSCGGPAPPPKIDVPGRTKPKGVSEGTTPKVGDPISAGGGEFREYWQLFALGGPIPLEFILGYLPDMESKTPSHDGPSPFPPSDAFKSFHLNLVMRMVEFTDKGAAPETDYVNISLFNDLLVFRYDTAAARYLPVGPVKYQLEKVNNYYYILMDPESERVYFFRSCANSYERTDPKQTIKRVGEILFIEDRNGNKITFAYNSDYLPTRVEDPATGRGLTLTYSSGRLSSAADDNGRSVQFNYDTVVCNNTPFTPLTGFQDVLGSTTTFTYDRSSYPCYLLQKINRPWGNSLIDQTWADNP